MNIDHESKPFHKTYKFIGADVSNKDSLGFRVKNLGTSIEISWSGAQPIGTIVKISNATTKSQITKVKAKEIKKSIRSTDLPFLKSELNEIETAKCNKPFVEGLWKRLHPEGTHPGLSSEEDSTFRYHISIVFAHYLLKRFEKYSIK